MENSLSQKQCPKCKQYKPATIEFFYPRKDRKKNPISSHCRQCHIEYQREKKGILPPAPDGQKRCRVCKACKPATTEYFEANKGCDYGIVATCKECKIRIAQENREASQGKMRQCSSCKQWKLATAEFFTRRNARKSGFHSICKECNATYRMEHTKERSQYNRFYRLNHLEESKWYSKQYRILNKDLISMKSSLYYLKHKERENQRQRMHYRTHRNQYILRNLNRRMRRRSIPGTLTKEQIRTKLKAQKYRCYYCQKKFQKETGKYIYQLEHTVPVSRTEENPRHDVNYIVLSCPTCNRRKSNKLPHEWSDGGRLL